MSNDMLEMVKATIVAHTTAANDALNAVRAATSDKDAVLHDFLTDDASTDETVKAYREWLSKVEAEIESQTEKMRAYALTKVGGTLTEDEIVAHKASAKEFAAQRKAGIEFLRTVPGYSKDVEDGLPALITVRGKTAGGSGTGGKRPRLVRASFRASTKDDWTEASEVRQDKEGADVTVTNFTILAKALADTFDAKISVKDLQAAAFDAAGTEDLNTLDGKVFEFAVSVGEQTVFVKVAPKAPTAE